MLSGCADRALVAIIGSRMQTWQGGNQVLGGRDLAEEHREPRAQWELEVSTTLTLCDAPGY